jgi:hypothetical protein
MTTYHTANGYTIHATRVGLEIDLHTRNAKGESISTVRMSEREARVLLADLTEVSYEL